MAWGADVWHDAINRMNNSVLRANEFADTRAAAKAKQEDTDRYYSNVERSGQGELMQEMLRARIDRMREPMPDFYNSGPTYSGATGWDNILREAFAKRGGGMDRRGGGQMNALAQLLGGV